MQDTQNRAGGTTQLGRIEAFTGLRVAGWVWDPTEPQRPVPVDIIVDGRLWRRVAADRPRPDLAGTVPAPCRCGFDVALPQTMSDGEGHEVIVALPGIGAVFQGCPLVFRSDTPGRVLDGYLEAVDGLTATGWAFDHARPGEPVELEIAVDGVPAGRVLASLPRPDLAAAGLGDGNCAFSVRLPVSIADGEEHALTVAAAGRPLLGSPLRFRSDPARFYRGSLDLMPGRDITGWAWHELEPDRPLAVEILIDGRPYRTVMADGYRADLEQSGKGDGRHAFRVPPPAIPAGAPDVVEVRARVAGIGVDLPGSPGRLDAATSYDTWVLRYGALDTADRAAIRARVAAMPRRPLLSVLMPVYDPPEELLRAAIGSLRRQLYPDWELCVADDASTRPHVARVLDEARRSDPRIRVVRRPCNGHISAASNSALDLASGEFVVLLDQDDELAEHALYLVAEELLRHADATIVYSDEDKIDAQGRRFDPYFKSGWNPDLIRSQNCISHLGAYRTALVRDLGGFTLGMEGSQDYDLALRIAERSPPGAIRHIPHVLYHWRAVAGSTALSMDAKSYAADAMKAALRASLARQGRGGRVVDSPARPYLHVKPPLPRPRPLVSVVVPTRDRPDLLRACLDGLLRRTAYAAREVLVVDNGSVRAETLDLLRAVDGRDGVRVLRDDGPFNFSALNNRAAAQARGEILLFLNDDVEPLHRSWLHEMVRQSLRPEVGAVGARLEYPSDTIQHAGIVLGVHGVAAHAHLGLHRNDMGHGCRAGLLQTVSAVTAACMAVRRALFEAVGGFDAEGLPVSYNDVDLCLRLGARGYRIVYTPFARLLHHESASRGRDDGALDRYRRALAEEEVMRRRWGDLLKNDPFYNPNLSLDREDFALAFPPRAPCPWRAAGDGQGAQPAAMSPGL